LQLWFVFFVGEELTEFCFVREEFEKALRTTGLVTSHSTTLILVGCSPTQFYTWQKTGCGIRYFLSFETKNWKCWLLRHYLNFCMS